jgi:hypothetical protein
VPRLSRATRDRRTGLLFDSSTTTEEVSDGDPATGGVAPADTDDGAPASARCLVSEDGHSEARRASRRHRVSGRRAAGVASAAVSEFRGQAAFPPDPGSTRLKGRIGWGEARLTSR